MCRLVTLYGSAEAAAAAETRCGADAAWAAKTSCAVCWVAVRPAVAELWNGGGKYGDWNSDTGVRGAPGKPVAEDIPWPTRSCKYEIWNHSYNNDFNTIHRFNLWILL